MNFIRGTVEGGHLKTSALDLDLAPIVKDIKAIEGKQVVFAFRPEAIEVDYKGKDKYDIDSQVDLTELLGDTTNVYANVGDVNVILKINPHNTPEMGAQFKFAVPYKAAYLFDSETELVIESNQKRH